MHNIIQTTQAKYKWYHGVIFYILINLIAGYGITLFVNIKEVYQALNKPFFAPPVFLFGIAWTINNILVITGNIWTLNLAESKNKSKLLQLQFWSWLNYAVFQYLSFGTRIPAMYFLPTFSMLILTIFSIKVAHSLDTTDMSFWNKVKSGRSITCTFLSVISWLVIASALGLGIWILN